MSFPVELDTFAAVFLTAGMGVLFGLWFFYERRAAVLNDHRRLVTVFHCIKCGLVYTRPRQRTIGKCPRCGFSNNRLKF